MISMNITIHLYIYALRFVQAHLRAFHPHAELPKLYNSYFGACMCLCVSLLADCWKHWKNSTVFIALLDVCTFFQHALFRLNGKWGGTERKSNDGCPILPSSVSAIGQCKEVSWEKGDTRKFLGGFFLDGPCILSASEASSGLKGSMALWVVSTLPTES